MKIFDFTNVPLGTLVEYSDHYLKDRCTNKRGLGILVDKKFYEGKDFGFPGRAVVCEPVIHWEGRGMASGCHPCLVQPKRKKDLNRIKWFEAEEDFSHLTCINVSKTITW